MRAHQYKNCGGGGSCPPAAVPCSRWMRHMKLLHAQLRLVRSWQELHAGKRCKRSRDGSFMFAEVMSSRMCLVQAGMVLDMPAAVCGLQRSGRTCPTRMLPRLHWSTKLPAKLPGVSVRRVPVVWVSPCCEGGKESEYQVVFTTVPQSSAPEEKYRLSSRAPWPSARLLGTHSQPFGPRPSQT